MFYGFHRKAIAHIKNVKFHETHFIYHWRIALNVFAKL